MQDTNYDVPNKAELVDQSGIAFDLRNMKSLDDLLSHLENSRKVISLNSLNMYNKAITAEDIVVGMHGSLITLHWRDVNEHRSKQD